jgi:hypothetical protein
MKIMNTMMAMLFLTVFGVSSCATLTPAVVEHEEEIAREKNNDEVKNITEKKTEERGSPTWDHEWDRGYSD